MTRPPKTPRPQRGPILPPRADERLELEIGLIQQKLIGRVVVAWSKLESVLDDVIWFLLDLEISRGRIITTRLDSVSRIRLIRELSAVVLSDTNIGRLFPIIDRIDILRDDRNAIIHSLWAQNERGVAIAMSLRTKPLEPDQLVSEEFSHERMRDIYARTEAERYKLTRLWNELRASHDKPSAPRRTD